MDEGGGGSNRTRYCAAASPTPSFKLPLSRDSLNHLFPLMPQWGTKSAE